MPQLALELKYLLIGSFHQTQLHVGPVVIDPKDQRRFGIDRRKYQPQNQMHQFFVVVGIIEHPGRFQKQLFRSGVVGIMIHTPP